MKCRVVVQAGARHQRDEHQLGDHDAGARRDPARRRRHHATGLHHEGVRLLR